MTDLGNGYNIPLQDIGSRASGILFLYTTMLFRRFCHYIFEPLSFEREHYLSAKGIDSC